MTADNRRVVCVAIVVAALHAALIASTMTKREMAAPVALASRTITAELLKPDRAAAPVAIQSLPTPAPPKPARHIARESRSDTPAPKPVPMPVPKPVPKPQPVADTPSQPPNTSPDSPAAAAVAPAVAPAQPAAAPATQAAAAPAANRPAMALNAPKNVSHLDCRIVQPEYPMLSKRRGETGVAYVRFEVGPAGAIENVELKQSSGFSRLDAAALAAMHDSSCKPYMEDGQPVRVTYTQPFDFNLRD